MPLGPFLPIPAKVNNKQTKVEVDHINDMREALNAAASSADVAAVEAGIPAQVEDAIANDATVIAAAESAATTAAGPAAESAVSSEIAARNLLEGEDINESAGAEEYAVTFTDTDGRRSWLEVAADGGPSAHATDMLSTTLGVDPTYDGELTGIAYAVADDAGSASDIEVGTDGHITDRVIARWATRLNDTTGITKDRVWLPDAIHEWWIAPLYVWTDTPYPRLLGGAISTTGEMLVTESVPGAGSRAVVVDTTDPDDHSVLTPFMAGNRVCVALTEHDRTTTFGVVVGNADGSIDSLAQNPITTFEPVAGVNLSYAQVFEIASLATATTRTFWVFSRCNDRWAVTEIEIDTDDGSVTSTFSRVVTLHAGNQTYMSIADAHATSGNQTLRIAFGYNPNASTNPIHYLEVDVVTGAITSPITALTGSPNIRTGTDLPIDPTTLTPMIADVASGHSRRLSYVRPGPYKPGVLYADWDDAAPDSATYKVSSIESGGSVTTESYGIAGPRVGFLAQSNYIAMGAFPDPCHDDAVAWARRTDGVSTLEVHRTDRAGAPVVKTIATSDTPIIRPYWPQSPFGVLYCDVSNYSPTSYTTYVASIRSAKENR